MNNDPPGIIIGQENTMRINNAFVENVSCINNSTGHILISRSTPEINQANPIQNLRLNINRNTVILNPFGRNMCLCCIREGMLINAVFSSSMTRSIPPQAQAFLIIVSRREAPIPPASVTTDRIAFVDTDNNFLYTGNPNDINRQIRFVISDTTSITNRMGRSIPLRFLSPGQMVRITHANFQTASIPPQTTAFHVQLI